MMSLKSTSKQLHLPIVAMLALGFLFSGCEEKKTTEQLQKGRVLDYSGSLIFKDIADNTIASLRFASARTSFERNQGLMDVNDMPEDAGMVFFFEQEEEQSFWMANTPLSLDIIYVNADFKIVSIYHSTTPFSKTSLPSGAPAKYVVETNAGYCIRYDIMEGDIIEILERE